MKNVLRIDASARTARSLSRDLADRFIDRLTEKCPQAHVTSRDVGRSPPPAVTEEWISAVFSKAPLSDEEKALTALSDTLIEELASADLILIATPMYNYGMPTALKAWFDQVIRVNKTFTFDLSRGDRPLEPTMCGKDIVVLTSWGEFGFQAGGVNAGRDHLVPHIRTCSCYLGARSFQHIGIEFQEFGDERHQRSKKQAWQRVIDLADQLAHCSDKPPLSGSTGPVLNPAAR